jgi:hypothetical protein
MLYVELTFTGATPDVNVSSAPGYSVIAKNGAGTLGVVQGQFTGAHITTLVGAGKSFLTVAQKLGKLETYGLIISAGNVTHPILKKIAY